MLTRRTAGAALRVRSRSMTNENRDTATTPPRRPVVSPATAQSSAAV
jgi:hypothetical protein